MKYKVEMVKNNRVYGSFYYNKLSRPEQAVRKSIEKTNRIDSLAYIANEYGEVWVFSVMKRGDKIVVRKIQKGGHMLNQDELDMIFTGNRTIYGVLK